jgi:pyruvate ferredoxin oxidoreductase alpha subunit
MKEFVEGSMAIATIVGRCRPGVVSAYPITPQTHIVEELAQMVADGHLKAQFVNVESEHSAASVVLGAEAAGVRSYTATSSQGLFLMAEVVFNIAGMRLPIVMTDANRAIYAPINIWNDLQDTISLRDAGWVQIYAENNQEAVDFHAIAYKLAEDHRVMLPVMVCMDGFILTHGIETVDMPTQEDVDKFLPPYKPLYKLDVNNPQTLGPLADPDYYLETRYALEQTHKEVLDILPEVMQDFAKQFGRQYNLIEEYQVKDAERVIVAMGSVCGTIKDVIDELRKKGKKVGLLKITSFRPFPSDKLCESLKNVSRVAVLDKAVSPGGVAPLAAEIRSAFCGKKKRPEVISSFVAGLGGRDITVDSIKEIFKLLTSQEKNGEYIDLKPELLKEKYE